MKLVTPSIVLMACLPVFSQDQLAIQFTAYRTATGIRVNGTLRGEPLIGTAKSVQGEDAMHVAHLKGNVELTIDGIRVQADEVDLHLDSGDIEPNGNVHLKPVTRSNQ